MKLRAILVLSLLPVLAAACQSTLNKVQEITAEQTPLRFGLEDEGFPELFSEALRYPTGGASIDVISHFHDGKFARMMHMRTDGLTYIRATTIEKLSRQWLPSDLSDAELVADGYTKSSIGRIQTALFKSGSLYCLSGMRNGTPDEIGHDSRTLAFFCDQRELSLEDGTALFSGLSLGQQS